MTRTCYDTYLSLVILVRNREKRSLDTIKWRNVQSEFFFQKIILAVMPVKSGLRSYGGLRLPTMDIIKIATDKSTVIWGYVATLLSVASGIIVLPLILRLLTTDEVGVYYLLLTITSFLALFDLGFSPQISRNLTFVFSGAQELKSDGYVTGEKKINPFLLKGLVEVSKKIYQKISIFVILTLLFIGTPYIYYVTKDHLPLEYIIPVWVLYCLGSTLSMYFYYLTAFIEGKGAVKKTKQIIVLSKSINILCISILLLLGLKLWAVVLGNFAYIIIYVALSKSSFYSQEIKDTLLGIKIEKKTEREIFYKIWYNARRIAVVYFCGFVINKFNVFISGVYLTLSDVASLGLLIQLTSLISAISENAFLVSQPEIASLRVQKENNTLINTFSQTIAIYILLFVIGSLFLIFCMPYMLVFIKSNTVLPSITIMSLYCIIILLERHHSTCMAFISTGNRVPYMESMIIAGIVIVLGSIIVLKYTALGIVGLILVQGVTQLVYANWKWPYEVMKELKTSYRSFLVIGFKNLWNKFVVSK